MKPRFCEQKLGIVVTLTHESIQIFLLKWPIEKKKTLKTNETFYLFPSNLIKKNNKVMTKKNRCRHWMEKWHGKSLPLLFQTSKVCESFMSGRFNFLLHLEIFEHFSLHREKILVHLFRENKLVDILEGAFAWLQITESVNVSGSHRDRKASALSQRVTSLISEHSLLLELEIWVQIHLNGQ